MGERGLSVDHVTIFRWVQRYAPEINKRIRPHLKMSGTSYRFNTLAVLSGYGLLWLELRDAECHIVIRDSSISYDRPVRGDIRAACARPDKAAMEAFEHTFQIGRAHV